MRLLEPVRAGLLSAGSRVWMAPLTRSRARMPGNVPTGVMAEHYAKRADPAVGAGLIVSEATPVCARGHGYYATPGVHTEAQVEGWRHVTDAVHARGGLIVCQLWHVGRVSHVSLQPGGGAPVGPTDVDAESRTYVDSSMERVATSRPRALGSDEVYEIVEEFAHGARMAKLAGFDGVEIHGANTYLLDQFTRDGMNTRTDEWGGSLEARLRFPLLVAEAVSGVFGAGRVGYRISPLSERKDARDSDPCGTFCALARGLGAMGLAYMHAVETWDRSAIDPRVRVVIPRVRDAFREAGGGVYVANGDYSPELAERAVGEGWCDAVAFGKLFISNPDLGERIRRGGPMAAWDEKTFYGDCGGGGRVGYTDYPALRG